MRFLFVWEQGGRLGHLSKLLPIARILRERGHEVLFAVKEVGTAYFFLGDEGFGYIQTPIPIGLKKSRREAASFADVLSEAGFGDATILGGMIRAWQTVFALHKPDVILSQHAPTVTQAAELFDIPCLKLGSGFESPPETSPYPCFRPWLKLTRDTLLNTENIMLDNVNKVRKDFGGAPLSHLHQAIRADLSLLAVLPELEHYPGRKNGSYIGPLFIVNEGESAHWSGHREHKIFAYLVPGNETPLVFEALVKCGAEVIAYIPGLAGELKEKYSTATMRIASGKINLSGLLPGMTLAISNANLGTVSATLLSGVPSLCVPTHIEQLMCCRSLERTGAGIGLNRNQLALRFEDTLNTMLSEKRYKQKAVEISKKYTGYDQKQVVMRLANTLEKMKLTQREALSP
jgi:UDP:flavonoid glycosyltransferase YjiC (YdhE family)